MGAPLRDSNARNLMRQLERGDRAPAIDGFLVIGVRLRNATRMPAGLVSSPSNSLPDACIPPAGLEPSRTSATGPAGLDRQTSILCPPSWRFKGAIQVI